MLYLQKDLSVQCRKVLNLLKDGFGNLGNPDIYCVICTNTVDLQCNKGCYTVAKVNVSVV